MLNGRKASDPGRCAKGSRAPRIRINAENAQQEFHSVTFGAVIDRYLREEMPTRVRKDTAGMYCRILDSWIRPKWGTESLQNIRTLPVENWLRGISRSANTRVHIRNLMHLLFTAPFGGKLTDKNPVNLVRQSTKRTRIPRVLTAEEFEALPAELQEPHRTIVLIAGCLGLRISEILGLQWSDVDGRNLTILIQRTVVEGKVYATKTEASSKPMPIDPKIAEALLTIRRSSTYTNPDDFIFAVSVSADKRKAVRRVVRVLLNG